jgi:MFS family permease
MQPSLPPSHPAPASGPLARRLASLRERARRSELRGPALWVVIGCLICQMGLGLTYVTRGFSADLIEALALSRAQFAGSSAAQLALQSLGSPLAGLLTVRYGASRVLAGSSLLFALVFFFYARVESLFGFYAVLAGVGLGAAGMGDITVGHVVTQWIRRRRGLALGIAYAGSNVGGAVMVQLTSWVAGHSNFRGGLLSVVAFSLLVLLPVSLWMVRDRPADAIVDPAPGDAPIDDSARAASATIAARSGSDGSSDGATDPDTSLDLRTALRTRSFWILTATLFSFFFYFTGALDHLVLFLTDTGLSKESARGWLSQAIGLGIVSKIAGGYIADRIPHEKSILYDYGLLAFSSLVLLLLPNPLLLPVFVVTFGFSQAARDVVYPLVIERCFGARHLASIYGVMTLTLLPGAVLGPLLAAHLRDELGDYRLAFLIFVVMNVLSLAALYFLRDERRQPGAPRHFA